MRPSRPRRRALTAATLSAAVVGLPACGGDEDKSKPGSKPASSPRQFADRFEPLTGVRLEPAEDALGTRLEEPELPDRHGRYGTYSLTWTKDDRTREVVLGRDVTPDPAGIYWERVSDSWSAAKPFGRRLVLQWAGEKTKRTTPEWDRIERAVRAAYLGKPELLPAAEQPCAGRELNPLRGRAGACSVAGIPVTFAEAGKPLEAGAMEAEVLGVDTADEIGERTTVPQKAKGRFVQVAYRVRNTSDKPLRFLRVGLRLGGKTLEPSAGAGVLAPRSRNFPIASGEEYETRAIFDVEPDLAEQARAKGAFVFPTELDDLGSPAPDIAQAWIRLAKARGSLPEPPEPERPPGSPPSQPKPTGPPDIKFKAGSGPPIGGSARRLFMANTYFPLPEDFVPGGVRIGGRARNCVVPRPTARDKAGLLAAARRISPEGRVPAQKNREILLAGCGRDGRWAITFWRVLRPGKSLKLAGDEFRLHGGRWVGSPKGSPPGCRIPDAAAAVWQIDISICDTPLAKRQRRAP